MRIGLIGASVRAASLGLASSNWLSIGIDQFSDQETMEVLGSRSLQARDAKHARSLVLQFSKSPRIRKRKRGNQGYGWLHTGGWDLEPELLQSLTWSGNQLLGCDLKAIELAKSIRRWSQKLSEHYPHVPKISQSQTGPGRWFRKSEWPGETPRAIWQLAVEGQCRSALFLACGGQVRILGSTRLYCIPSNSRDQVERSILASGAGPWWYWGNELCSSVGPDEAAELMVVGQWFASHPGVQGIFGIDYLKNDHVWPIEINPRPTASLELIQIAHDENLWRRHVQVSLCHRAMQGDEWAIAMMHEAMGDIPAQEFDGEAILDAKQPAERNKQLMESKLAAAAAIGCKRTVYNRSAKAWVAEQETLDCWQQACDHFADRSGMIVEMRDRPRPQQSVPVGAPLCTLWLQSKPEDDAPFAGSELAGQSPWQLAAQLEQECWESQTAVVN